MFLIRRVVLIAFIILLATGASDQSFTHSKQTMQQIIVIMRHGEKVKFRDCSKGQLSCQGLNRALMLPQVLYSKFGKPDYLFAPDPVKKMWEGCRESTHYVRPLATIEPIGIKYNMPVYTPFTYDHHADLVNLLLTEPYHDSVIFVAWEHLKIYLMATMIITKLGGNPIVVPTWPAHDYDSLYVLTIDWDKGKGKVRFVHDYQNLDGQISTCPVPIQSAYKKKVETILIIPAGETSGHAQLNCKGLNRGLGLQRVLVAENKNIGLEIDDFFAADPGLSLFKIDGKAYYYQRSFMTIEPSAIYHAKPLWTQFGYDDSVGMAVHVADKKFRDRTIAIAWEPTQIQRLATLIYIRAGGNRADIPVGVPHVDTIYKITLPQSAAPIFETFSAGLTPSAICP